MTQNEIMEMAKQTGVLAGYEGEPSFLIIFAKVMMDIEREACAKTCEQIALGFTNWPESFEGVTAETKLMRSLGEFVHKPFTEAIRARGHE